MDAARPVSHPLHDSFEWDDSVAGEAYRKVQAGKLIRTVMVTRAELPDESTVPQRAFYAVRTDCRGAAEFMPATVALTDPVKRQLVLNEYRRALSRIRQRYEHLPEFADYIREYLLGES